MESPSQLDFSSCRYSLSWAEIYGLQSQMAAHGDKITPPLYSAPTQTHDTKIESDFDLVEKRLQGRIRGRIWKMYRC